MPYYYLMQTKDEMKWNICSDTKVESGFNMQKATTDFGGRKWIAWFTQDIPISEGVINLEDYPDLFLRSKMTNIILFILSHEIKIFQNL